RTPESSSSRPWAPGGMPRRSRPGARTPFSCRAARVVATPAVSPPPCCCRRSWTPWTSPVIAAGGFRDGRGLVAALAYGAAGVAMGTRFLLTSDSTVPDAVKARYLAAGVQDVIVTTKVDGLPHRMLRTDLVDALERSGRSAALLRAFRHASAFRRESGMSWAGLVRDGLAMKHGKQLTWSQVLLAANTPMLLRAAMVDGRTDLGVMACGQVGGLIDDLPSCAELVERIMAQAHATLGRLPTLSREHSGAAGGRCAPGVAQRAGLADPQ
ncbi:LOW QUALITY PROTEIN: enoyl-ACP reductase II, partial [Streptomyces viridochromogenes DSM 40736]